MTGQLPAPAIRLRATIGSLPSPAVANRYWANDAMAAWRDDLEAVFLVRSVLFGAQTIRREARASRADLRAARITRAPAYPFAGTSARRLFIKRLALGQEQGLDRGSTIKSVVVVCLA